MSTPDHEITTSPIDPELEKRWINWKVCLGALAGAAGVLFLAKHMQGDTDKEVGSYFKTAWEVLEQRDQLMTDPSTVLVEFPEHRTLTNIVATAASIVGNPLHRVGDLLPKTIIPDFVTDIRTFVFRGSPHFFFEQIDIIVGGSVRTISTLTGAHNALGMYNSPEKDRALRILMNFELGKQAMSENGLRYTPPSIPDAV